MGLDPGTLLWMVSRWVGEVALLCALLALVSATVDLAWDRSTVRARKAEVPPTADQPARTWPAKSPSE